MPPRPQACAAATPTRCGSHRTNCATYATQLVNAGMSMQALMALLGHVTPEMTLRYTSLASPTIRSAYDTAMAKVRSRQQLPLIVADRPVVPTGFSGYTPKYSRPASRTATAPRYLTADACPYANICEQCDNFTTSTEFLPQLHAQLTDALALREDAQARGWDSEVARHARVITSLQRHLDRLRNETQVSRRN
ncbi:MAG: hypothetical protein M3332_14875 [Actinomycetota bacterium]|nr:hypothetical protein [Actinomycetota bacterium]